MNDTLKTALIAVGTDTAVWSIATSTYRAIKPVAGRTAAVVAGTVSACAIMAITATIIVIAADIAERKAV